MSRCPGCGATNRADAPWCGQCHAPLDRAASPVQAATGDAPHAADRGEPGRGRPDRGDPAAAAFRHRDGDVEWACVVCGRYNPLDVSACSTCATPLTARYEAARPEPQPATRAAFALSVVLPGGGHVLAGHAATGVARAVLFAVWFGGGLLLASAGGGLLLAAPLLAGALAVWGGTLADVAGLGTGRRELLRGRALLWLVIGVTVLLLVALAAGVAGLGRAPAP